jgi:hypothetical protein
MADRFLKAMLEYQLERLPTFTGERYEDVIQWLKDMTDELNCVSYDDNQKVMIIPRYIQGGARKWLMYNMPILKSWSTFTLAMREAFGPRLLNEGAGSIMNEDVQGLDKTSYYDNNIKEEPTYELLKEEEEEEKSDYSTTTLVGLNTIVSLSKCIIESGGVTFEIDWPNGGGTWFIHDALPQRLHFIQCKQQEVPFNSTPNIHDELFSQNKLSSCTDVVLSSIMNDKAIYFNQDVQVFDISRKLHDCCTDVISFILLLDRLATIIINSRQIFISGKTSPHFYRNVRSGHAEDRNWFWSLAVP